MRLARGSPARLMALLLGGLQALALADPWSGQPHGWLQLLSLAGLVWLLQACAARQRSWSVSTWGAPAPGPAWRRGLALGWLFALGWLVGTFWWLFISMHTYGGLPALLALLAVLALAGLLALAYGLAAAAFVAGWLSLERWHWLGSALAFAALWTLAELVRGTLFTGFPWGAGGYAHVDGVLNFVPRHAGVYGTGFVAALLAALLALAAQARWRRPAPWLLLTLLIGLGVWGQLQRRCAIDFCYTPPSSQRPLVTQVALLQGNIAQDQKFVAGTGVADSLRWYGEQLRDARASLVVAPETALPLLPHQLPEGFLDALVARYAGAQQAALLGMPMGDMTAGYTNSVLGLKAGQGGTLYRYDKHHLVPFGEFIPRFFKWFTAMMHIPLGDFERGAIGQPSFDWAGQRLAPNICYEDLFGEELAARFADPTRAPTAFVNVSNIAWFGNSVAIDQHLQISRMRALEFERPMLRATNTGATAIIDHRGAVTHRLPRLTRDVLHGTFEGRQAITPFAAWAARWGLQPLGAACLLLVALTFGAVRCWRLQGPAGRVS